MLFYILKIILIGIATGLLSGMLGVGGALLSTPAIRLLLKVPPLIAVGTPLPVVIPTALSGGIVYFRRGLAKREVIQWAAPTGMVGATLGAILTKFVSGHYLLLLTALIIFYLGVRFLHRSSDEARRIDLTPAPKEQKLRLSSLSFVGTTSNLSAFSSAAIGLGAGFVAGLLGIGGGIVLVPAFIFWGGMSAAQAFGTSLVTIAFMAVPSSVVHFLLGHIDIKLVILLTLTVIPGGYLGALLTSWTKERWLLFFFGLFLVFTSFYLALNEILFL